MKGERKEAMERELLKWVAEELLGWEPAHFGMSDGEIKLRWWVSEGKKIGPGYLESWHGIGLVVGEMERRGFKISFDNFDGPWDVEIQFPPKLVEERNFGGYCCTNEKTWFAVYEAARKAVG